MPNNNLNYQEPVSGQAYSGVTCYSSWEADWRHIIAIELLDTLEIGETYYVSFYLNKSTFHDLPGRACNKQGARFFTENHWEEDWVPLDNWAHVVNDWVLTDTLLWHMVKGSILADSMYKYIAIGNFFNDANTTVSESQDINDHRAFYLVDEVRVSTDSTYAFEELVPTNINFNSRPLDLAYPNPTSTTFRMKGKWEYLRVFDLFGRPVLQSSYKEEVNISNLPMGVYIIWVDNHSIKLVKE